MNRIASIALMSVLPVMIAVSPARVLAWEWRDLLRSNNGNVEDGNERLHAGDHQAALAAYDAAAKELPSEGGVHLNRGLALLAAGDLPKARESLLRATEPPASADVRAAGYYNLGLAFYREGDARAGEDDHKEAQAMFRESADALKRSLRLVPGNRDAAWNLELAMRRIRDEQEKQRQQEEQEKQEQEKQEQEKQEQGDNQDSPNDESGDGEQQPEDGESQDQQQPKGENQDGDQDGDQEQPQDPPEKQGDENPQPQDQTPQDQDSQQEQPQEAMPREAERALDALQQGEENLERMRARQRAGRERRAPSKDW